jgi:hypothetical protein
VRSAPSLRGAVAREGVAARGGRTCRVAAVGGWVAATVGGGRGACRPGGRARRADGLAGGDGECGPSAAQAGSGRSRLAAGSSVTCGIGWWACQDLNLGPHPDPKIHGELAGGSTRRSRVQAGRCVPDQAAGSRVTL